MAFFEPISAPPPTFDRDLIPLPWEEGLGQTVFSDVGLAEGPDGKLMLRTLIAYPKVITLSVEALLRHPLEQGLGTRGDNCPRFGPSVSGEVGTGIVLFGLRFSDGTCYRNLDDRSNAGHLRSLRGGGGCLTGHHDFWVPLPTPGELEIWVAWPAAGIPETRTPLDASLIRGTAAALTPPWS